MKLKHSSLFLAFVLATAGPAFADHIAAGSTLEDGGFLSNETSTQLHQFQNTSVTSNSEMRIFKEGKGGSTGDGAVQFCSFDENKTGSDTGMPVLVGTESDDHKVSLAGLDCVTSPVPIPEPGSQLLLVAGLAVLGISLSLRHVIRIAN